VNIFRFRDRVGILDERSQHFLQTVAWLGGYVTPEQAQELGIRNSVTRVHVQLKDLESWGFIKRITTSNVYGDLGIDAKRRIQQRLVAFVNEQAKAAEEASRIEAAWKRQPVTVQ
jgi:hypothetical protein